MHIKDVDLDAAIDQHKTWLQNNDEVSEDEARHSLTGFKTALRLMKSELLPIKVKAEPGFWSCEHSNQPRSSCKVCSNADALLGM